jgi:hypothetical protein
MRETNFLTASSNRAMASTDSFHALLRYLPGETKKGALGGTP